jgi:hypothetical protein
LSINCFKINVVLLWFFICLAQKSILCRQDPVTIQWLECSIVTSLIWKSHCFPCHPGMILVTGFDVLFLLTYSAMSSYQFIVTSEQSSWTSKFL